MLRVVCALAALMSGSFSDKWPGGSISRLHGDELQTALAGEFAADEEATCTSADREWLSEAGAEPKWDWEPIVAEAAMLYAQSGGTMAWKNLVSTIMELAARQTGKAPADSTAEERAARIRDAWQRISTLTRQFSNNPVINCREYRVGQHRIDVTNKRSS